VQTPCGSIVNLTNIAVLRLALSRYASSRSLRRQTKNILECSLVFLIMFGHLTKPRFSPIKIDLAELGNGSYLFRGGESIARLHHADPLTRAYHRAARPQSFKLRHCRIFLTSLQAICNIVAE
jgi:hypothetical protein